MKSGRATSPIRELTTMDLGSKSVPIPDWEPEPHQIPITQPEPGPEKTRTVQPASKTQQGPNTQQEPASQQRSLTQQEPLAQHEAESQHETRAQQKSALQQEILAPQEPAPQQSPPNQRVPFTPEGAASQQRSGTEKESKTQQEPELEEAHVAQPAPGPLEPPLAQQEAGSTPPSQTESISQEEAGHSDPIGQQTAPDKSQQGSLMEWGFLSKLHELSIQRPASEWKIFLEWITDFNSESDPGYPFETDSPAVKDGTMTQGMKLDLKKKPGYEEMSGCGGTSAQGPQAGNQNHRHSWDTGELHLEERESPRDGYSFRQEVVRPSIPGASQCLPLPLPSPPCATFSFLTPKLHAPFPLPYNLNFFFKWKKY